MKALHALEGVAVEISKNREIKFSHKCIPYPTRMQADNRDWQNYLNNLKQSYVDCYEPAKMISDAKQMLGENDFFFEWKEKPTTKQLETLMEKIVFYGTGKREALIDTITAMQEFMERLFNAIIF